MLQLNSRGFRNVTRQQPSNHIIAPTEHLEQLTNARHDPFPGSRQKDLLCKPHAVPLVETGPHRLVSFKAEPGYGFIEDHGVGATCHRNPDEPVSNLEDLFEGTGHRPQAGATGEDQRAIDIKQNELRHESKAHRLTAPSIDPWRCPT